MLDMTNTIVPKSDQWNADDFLAGPKTVTITKVTGNEESREQPINVYFTGDDGKPFRPSKSMRRVMVHIWGKDASTYPGKSMTLYRDPSVKFGGMEVGGIRISHMTGIDSPVTMALTATRASRKPYVVKPLADAPKPEKKATDPISDYGREVRDNVKKMTVTELAAWWTGTADKREEMGIPEDRLAKMTDAVNAKLSEGE